MSVSYFVGKKTQAIADKLSANHLAIVASDSVTKSATSKVDSAKKSSDILTTYRAKVRAKIEVRGDSVLVKGDTAPVLVNANIAQLIAADDSALKAKDNVIAAQDSLIASLHKGISLRDERIKLLESKGSSRFSKGIQAGIGYCATATGQMPCAFVGYGLQVRLP